jgi:predicted phosphodiesterase
MRTLIISDLHLGSTWRADVLRVESIRAVLVDALREVDRLVLLGDVLELRHGPSGASLRAAGPVLQDLGAAIAGKELVLVAGNHDHALVDGWLRRRSESGEQEPLAIDESLAPEEASPLAATLAHWAAPAKVSVAYPGVWIRDDVYAMHGHYLDCHLTVPTLERLAIATMGRMLSRPPESLRSVDDYEAVSAPIYAWIDAVAATGRTGAALNGSATMRMWSALKAGRRGPTSETASRNGSSRRWTELARQRIEQGAVRYGFPLAIAAANRAKLGPLSADVSTATLRRAGLTAMGEVARRLGVGDGYVVFGHTHRPGPLSGDDDREWTPGGVQLVNCGSWAYSPGFLTTARSESPYWPGSCVIVESSGRPEVRRLLIDRSHDELRPARA